MIDAKEVRQEQNEIIRTKSRCRKCVPIIHVPHQPSPYAKVQTPPATPTASIVPIPHITPMLPTRGTAPFFEPVPDEEPCDDADDPPAVAGVVGVNTDCALAKHDVAAALAEDTSEGAAVLMVALPAKLQDCGLRLLAW